MFFWGFVSWKVTNPLLFFSFLVIFLLSIFLIRQYCSIFFGVWLKFLFFDYFNFFKLIYSDRMSLFLSARTERKPNEKERVRTRLQLLLDASYMLSYENQLTILTVPWELLQRNQVRTCISIEIFTTLINLNFWQNKRIATTPKTHYCIIIWTKMKAKSFHFNKMRHYLCSSF